MPHKEPKIDLVELRKKDKLKPKKELTDEQKALIEEQEKTGTLMDNMFKREQLLRNEKETFRDNESLLLYRLPLNEEQMKAIHSNLTNKNIN